MLKKLFGTIFLITVLTSTLAFSGGFQLNEHGAKAMAQGGAFAARANDPSAIFFNPAGIAQLKDVNIYLGATLVSPSMKFTGPTPLSTETDLESKVYTPINIYATYAVSGMISVGLGINNPFGLGTKWPDTWIGSQLSVKSEVQVFNINPTVAVNLINGILSVGAGFDFSLGTVELTRKLKNPLTQKPELDFTLSSKLMDGTGAGYNFGVLFKPTEEISIGVSYRSKIKLKISGDAKVNPNPTHPLAKVLLFSENLTADSELELPSTAFIAAAYKINNDLTVELDAQFVGWSSYNKLTINFNKPMVNPAIDPSGSTITSSVNKNYKDVWIIRLGGEYIVNDLLTLRAGYFHDFNPVPDETLDPMLPDSDRNGFNIGAGLNLGIFHIDVAYLFLPFNERTTTVQQDGFNGKYNTTTHLFGIDLGFSL